jgi:low temperature requirement protein LtrA
MRSRWLHSPRLHTEHHEPKRVSWLELFYDLILVAAAIQLGDALSGQIKYTHQALIPSMKFAGFFATLFWAWASFTFYSNRFDIDDFTHRGLVFLNMMAIGARAIVVPSAMAGKGTSTYAMAFGLSFGLITLMYVRAWRNEEVGQDYTRFQAMVFGVATSVILLSALVPAPWRFWLWAAAVIGIVAAGNVRAAREQFRRHPVDMEHLSERFGLLIIIVLGESFVKVLSQLSNSELSTEPSFIATSLLTLLVTLCVWWIYFDDVAGSTIRNKAGATTVWIMGHMPLAIGITALGVGLKKLVGSDFAGVAPPEYRWLLGGAIALTFVSVAVIDSVTERRNVLLSDALRIKVRLASAFVVLLATAVGDTLPAGGFVAVITALCLIQVVFDVMMAPFEESADDVQVASGREASELVQQQTQARSRDKAGDVFGQAVRANVPEGRRQDLYLFLMQGSWAQLIVGTVLVFFLTNLVFAGLYLLDPGSIASDGAVGLAEAFAFSVQTISTIGFGAMSPATPLADLLVSVEAVVGVLGFAFLTGLIFAKASRPQPGIIFAERIVITERNGVPTLMLRVGNVHASELIDTHMQVSVAMEEVTAEGGHLTRNFPLKLVVDRVPLFALSFVLMHIIDETSPLHGLEPDALRERIRVIIMTISGHDTIYGHQVSARNMLFSSAIHVGSHYVDVTGATEDGRLIIDFAKFHDIEADAPAP